MASINPQNLDVTPSLAADDRVMTTNKDGITKTIMGSTLLEFFAEGTTADAPGGAQNKVITLTDFEGSVLPAQFKINITFTEGNTFGDTTASTPTYPRIILKNKSGAALGTFDVCDSRGHAAGTGCWNNNDFISFKRYGSKLIITNSDVRQAVTSSTNGYTIYSDGTFKQWFKNISSVSVTYGAGYLWYGYGTSIQRTSLVSQNVDNVSVGINSSNDWGAYEIFDQSLAVYVYSHVRHIATLTQHVMIEGHI